MAVIITGVIFLIVMGFVIPPLISAESTILVLLGFAVFFASVMAFIVAVSAKLRASLEKTKGEEQ